MRSIPGLTFRACFAWKNSLLMNLFMVDSLNTNGNVEQCVELLCQKGCRAVWEDIALLENGGQLPETAGLKLSERKRVLNELKAVMAVYDGKCLPE